MGQALEPTQEGEAGQRLLCHTGAAQGGFVCFANRHEQRVCPGTTALMYRRAKFKSNRGRFLNFKYADTDLMLFQQQ